MSTHSSIAASSATIVSSDLRNFCSRQKLSSLFARSSQFVNSVRMFTFNFVAILYTKTYNNLLSLTSEHQKLHVSIAIFDLIFSFCWLVSIESLYSKNNYLVFFEIANIDSYTPRHLYVFKLNSYKSIN